MTTAHDPITPGEILRTDPSLQRSRGLMLLFRVKSAGCVEPGAVAGGEFGVGSASEFEFADPAGHTPRCVAAAVRVRSGSSGRSQIRVVGDGAVPGEGLEDLAGDGAFQGAEDGLAVRPFARCLSRYARVPAS